MEEGEVDYDWVEREMLEQELSSRFAAQRDEDYDNNFDDDPEEEEPPSDPDDGEEVKPSIATRIEGTAQPDVDITNDASAKHQRSTVESESVAVSDPKRQQVSHQSASKPYENYFLKYPLLKQRQVTITFSNGDRRYCGIQTEPTKSNKAPSDETKWVARIDTKTFSKIESDVELKLAVEQKVAEAVETSGHLLKRKPAALAPGAQKLESMPLVQRFAPNRFIDLLSHERKNREALKWLKSFDKRQPIAGEQKPTPTVLLLAGPPGAGKTTMAHVLARHAGYRVVEINASDERSGTALKEKLSSATEMKSVFDQDGRRNLVVLDEVDGISDGVQAVVQYATSPSNIRPLICTCNDAYAPALRPLRRISMVLNLVQPSRTRLVKRLREICNVESVDYGAGALEILAGRMDDDVRASLNALDFFIRSSKQAGDSVLEGAVREIPRKPVLDAHAVRTLPTFAKDGTADLWATWKQILQQKRSPGSQEIRGKRGVNEDLLASVSRHLADLDLVVDGVHENYLRNRFTDPSFTKTHRACDWLSFVDVVQTRTSRELDFSFASYCAAGLVGIGRAVTGGGSKMVFPSAAAMFRMTRTRNQEAIAAFFESPAARTLPKREFPVETVALFLQTLVPHVRPIPIQALSFDEKKEVDRAVSLMDEFGLCWMEPPEGHLSAALRRDIEPTWSLDPGIDKLVTFNGQRTVGILSSDLARSVNARLRRRSTERTLNEEGFRQVSTSSGSIERTSGDKDRLVAKDEEKPAKRAKVEAAGELPKQNKPAFSTENVPFAKRDFFGRVIQLKSCESAVAPQEISQLPLKHGFTFRFNEGLTDAVRRVVKIQDLL